MDGGSHLFKEVEALKSIWKKLRQAPRRESTGDEYRKRIVEASDRNRIVAGRPEDRLHGLGWALERAKGRSLLDVGCHDGTVALAFAELGCTIIDGFDLNHASIVEAKRKFESSECDAAFETADLALGVDGIRSQLRCNSYSIVCYLGVHQHIRKQIGLEELEALEWSLLDMTEEIFALRVPERFFDDLNARIIQAGFEPVTELVRGNVGPSRIYQRISS